MRLTQNILEDPPTVLTWTILEEPFTLLTQNTGHISCMTVGFRYPPKVAPCVMCKPELFDLLVLTRVPPRLVDSVSIVGS
jgi:hypothetical protein